MTTNEEKNVAYYPQGAAEMNGLRHMVLLYGSRKDQWTEERLRAYAAWLDDDRKPQDWMFDAFLFTPSQTPSGQYTIADINRGTSRSGEGDFYAIPCPNPANRRGYEELLGLYFDDDGWLATLNTTLGNLKKEIDAPAPKHNVCLLVPYPGIAQTMWGRLPGGDRSLNFSVTGQSVDRATQDRLAATKWFVDQALERWSAGRYPNLNLLGFYWPFETVYRGWEVDDHVLLKNLKKHINTAGKVLTWIPFYATYNTHLLDNYRDYYFDLAFQQPNHMFYVDTPGIEVPARVARDRYAGFEMEYYYNLQEPLQVQGERKERFRDYLNGGVEFGFMREAACAWFHDGDGIEHMLRSTDPEERAFYDDVYRFIKGTYEPK